MKTDAEKLAEYLLQAHIGVSLWPYPPERIDMPKKEFDYMRELAQKILDSAASNKNSI